MRKNIYLFFLLITKISTAQLPAESLEIRDKIFSAGYGFPYLSTIIFADYFNEPGFNMKTNGPYYLKYEQIISDDMSLGVNIAYAANKGSFFEKYNQYNSNTGIYTPVSYLHKIDRETFSVLIRANWYFSGDNNFYAYFGGGLGYRSENWSITSTDPNDQNQKYTNQFPLGLEATVGARYLLSDFFSVYGEAGLAKSPLQLGICLILGTEELDESKIRKLSR